MYWADTIGVAEVYRQIQAWHQQHGERWAPPPSCAASPKPTPRYARQSPVGRCKRRREAYLQITIAGQPRRQANAWCGYTLGMARPVGLMRS
jgi:hypothetical protein